MHIGGVVFCVDRYLAALQVRKLVPELHGYAALTACNCNHALQLAPQHYSELALIEHSESGLDGWRVAPELHRIQQHLHIVLLAGEVSAEIPAHRSAEVDAVVLRTAGPRQWLVPLLALLPASPRTLAASGTRTSRGEKSDSPMRPLESLS